MSPRAVALVGVDEVLADMMSDTIRALPEMLRLTGVWHRDSGTRERIALRLGVGELDRDSAVGTEVVVVGGRLVDRGRDIVAACRAGARIVIAAVPLGLNAREATAVAAEAERCGTRLVPLLPDLADEVVRDALTAVADDELLAVEALVTVPAASPAGFDADELYTEHAVGVIGAGDRAARETVGAHRRLRDHATPAAAAALALVGDLDGPATVDAAAGGALAHLRHGNVGITIAALEHPVATGSLTATSATSRTRLERSPVDLDATATVGRTSAPSSAEVRASGLQQLLAAAMEGRAPEAERAIAAQRALEPVPPAAEAVGRRVGLLGTGVISTVHATAASVRGAVAAYAGRRLDAAQDRARVFGGSAYALDDPGVFDDVDAVIVATAPSAHAALAQAAIEHGVPVLVEKPFTRTVAEARSLVALARDRGVRIVYGENWAYRPDVQAAATAARGHGVRHVDVRGHWLTPPWGGYLDPATGGGVLLDAAPHVIELARLLLGRPAAESVSAVLRAGPTGVDVFAELHVAFAGRASARIIAEWGAGPLEVTASADGFRFVLAPVSELDVAGQRIDLPRADGVGASLHSDGILGEHAALTGDGPLACSPDDAVAVVEIVAAAATSARLGEACALPFAGDLDATPLELWGGVSPAP